MEQEKFLSIGKVAQKLGVSTQTIRRWQQSGKIQEVRSPTNRRLYSVQEVQRILGRHQTARVVIYARVSSPKQKADGHLERQVERLKAYAAEHGLEVFRIFQEQASGLNENRQQLSQLLAMAERREFQRVLIEYPDRLARFGYRYLERYLNSHGVTIESVHVQESKTSQEELTEDLLTIITVFSARLYGKRSQEFRQKTQHLVNAMKEGEPHGDGHEDHQTGCP
ncbi:IS607 family transposase [Sulfobacillus thermosulfidooxidans]|uniref:IS607 family transposase n=1 Tax=Sulfobacillus thermosulfidooxidans TaxID=28034 RepID=UPI0006B4B0AA|nr:IS607 family transposase [Sulfobacillus thermosulfidooxidans]